MPPCLRSISLSLVIKSFGFHYLNFTNAHIVFSDKRFCFHGHHIPGTEASAISGSHAIAVLTEWKQFRDLDYKSMFETMQRPAFVFDGRDILDHSALRKIGFQVYCVGKASVDTSF